MAPANHLELLNNFLKETPDDPFTHYAIGLEYLKLNEFENALSGFQTCLLKDKNYLPVYYQLGKVLENLNRPEESSGIYLAGMQLAKQKKDNHTYNELKGAYDAISE